MEKLDKNKSLFKEKIEERKKVKIRENDILEIPKGPHHSTLFWSAILKHSSAIKSP
jgi:hypothetical protein